MKNCGSSHCPSSVLNEQIAARLFSVLSDQGPFAVILDRDGNHWPSDSHRFEKFFADRKLLSHVCSSIDDGCDPVTICAGGATIVGTQLDTEWANCGYLLIALPDYTAESALANMDLVELILNQAQLIATLVEANGLMGTSRPARFGKIGCQEPMVAN